MNILPRDMEVPVKENVVAEGVLQEIVKLQDELKGNPTNHTYYKLGCYIADHDSWNWDRTVNYATLPIMETIETLRLVDVVRYAHLYSSSIRENTQHIRSIAKAELSKRISYPHIVKHNRNDMCEYACIHCGEGFDMGQYYAMGRHGSETECVNKFSNLTCPCGKTCESMDKAHSHRLFHITMEVAKKKEQEQKEHKKEVNAQRKIVSRCEVCNVGFRCKKEEELHMNGLVHKYKVKPKEINNCKLCGTTTDMTPAQYQAHIQTKKHQKKVEESQAPKRKTVTIKVRV